VPPRRARVSVRIARVRAALRGCGFAVGNSASNLDPGGEHRGPSQERLEVSTHALVRMQHFIFNLADGDRERAASLCLRSFADRCLDAPDQGRRCDPTCGTERAIQQLAAPRDALVAQLKSVLDGTDNGHQERSLTYAAER